MKKIVRMILLAAAVAALLCVAALAAEPSGDKAGIYNVSKAETLTITPKTANKANAETTTDNGIALYTDAVRFDISANGYEKGEECLLLVIKGAKGTLINDDTIAYIDQTEADENGKVTFEAYPKDLEKEHYCVYLVGTSEGHAFDSQNPTAEFDSYVPYKLGDVDEKDGITATDASYILQYLVNKITLTASQKLAADVNHDNGITATDASYILQYVVNKIPNFESLFNK